jgi:hypothetical protein
MAPGRLCFDHMTTGGQHLAFENGASVPTVDFDYPDPVDQTADEMRNGAAFELLEHGLMLAIGSGHRDGLRTRILALMRLCGMFSSDAAAAAFGDMNRSSLSRAVRRLRKEMACSLSPEKTARIARKQKRFSN